MTTSTGIRRLRLLPMLVVQCLVVLACVAITTLVATSVQERTLRQVTTERVLDVSRSLAALDQVRTAVTVDRTAAMAELQPLADLIEQAAGVDYVVITDAEGIRLTHPTASQRGLEVSTDPADVLAGETFVGTETGTLGPTLRAKVPVTADGVVVGTASVGILESEIAADFDQAIAALLPWVLASVVAGCAISAALVVALRGRVRRLEDRAREAETQRRIAGALRDATHEFRTRLHVIRGLVAEGDADAALQYVDGIAPVSTPGRDAPDVADPALRALVTGLADDAAGAGVTLELDPLTTVTPAVMTDADLVVIANLCRNAIEAASAHPAAAGRVRLLVVADAHAVHIVVDDDGPGIPDAARLRIFERGMTTKTPEGTAAAPDRGVGLDIVRREIAARAGTIEVGRSAWGGARFTVDMPAAPAEVRR